MSTPYGRPPVFLSIQSRAVSALGHAYGGGSQFFSMWVVAGTPS
jgi:hypothetical protein